MAIITLLKANIRHKKGSFISIILLMIIISMSMTSIFSLQDNYKASIDDALEQVDTGNITIIMESEKLTDELINSVKNHEMVERVKTTKAILIDKAELNGKTELNGWFLRRLSDEYKIFNSDMTAYESETPALKRGEIYLPHGLITKLGCAVGDTVKLTIMGQEYDFKIKGFVAEPLVGAFVIGSKQVFISDADFDRLSASIKSDETDQNASDLTLFQVYKSSDCTLSDGKFSRQLNLNTGINDYAVASLTKTQSAYYTGLFPDIVLKILIVFIAFLIVIEFIVMQHSISTGIEMDYVNLGVLKSQGFTKGKISAVFVLQYLIAEFVGAVVGIILSLPLTNALNSVFMSLISLVSENKASVGKSMLLIVGILVLSGLFILYLTRSVGKISPVRAISGAKKEIYFDSRIKTPICKTGLSASLALRQFNSNKRRYFSTILIVAILSFFMLTINVLGNVFSSKSAMESMGTIYAEVGLSFKENVDDETLEKIEETIERYSAIERKYHFTNGFMSIEGEQIVCQVYKTQDELEHFITKGRAPIYDNEIVITEIIADELDLKMGDEVTVSYDGKSAKYVISGIFVSMSDTGRTFSMLFNSAEKLGIDRIDHAFYRLSNPEMSEKIVRALNICYGNILEARVIDDQMMGTYTMAVSAIKAVIYTFSIIFALVVVVMVCSKMFMQEKTDIGIYKALGFTSTNLRIQFAVRFLIVSIVGLAIGSVLSVLFSGKLLISLLRLIGATNIAMEYTADSFIVPISIISTSFFIFAYIASRKIKSVEVRDLVVE